jgi:hypothetical protein
MPVTPAMASAPKSLRAKVKEFPDSASKAFTNTYPLNQIQNTTAKISMSKDSYASKKVALIQKINTRKTANTARANKLSVM